MTEIHELNKHQLDFKKRSKRTTLYSTNKAAGYGKSLHDSLKVLSEPEFYVDFDYKLKKNVSRADFPDQFRKVIIRYKLTGYINVMRQSAYLVVNPITVNNFASLFNYTPIGRASDSMMGLI